MPKLFFCIIALIVVCPAQAQEIRSKVKIAAIASLTGPAAEQGKNWLMGAQLAQADLAARGVSVELIVEDDGTNPSKAVTAIQKVLQADRVQAVLGGTWDFLFEAMVPVSARAKVPLVTMTTPIEIFSKAALSSGYAFSNSLSIARAEEAMESLVAKLAPKRMAIVSPEFPYTKAYADSAKRIASKLGISVVFDSRVPIADMMVSIKTLALKTAQSQAELVCVMTSAELLDSFLAAYRQVGGKAEILTMQHLDGAYALTGNKSMYVGTYGVYPKMRDEKFEKRFSEKYSTTPRVYAAEGYDATMFVASLLDQGRTLGDVGEKFEYQGLMGNYRFPAISQQLSDVRAQIFTIKDGAFKPIDDM